MATILVWEHWLVVAFYLVQLAYRPGGWSVRVSCASSTGGPVSSDWAGASPHTRVGLSIGIGACIS